MAEFAAAGEKPDVLFYVGCAGRYDDRAKKISSAFAKILNHLNISFGILGSEESCSGDPAKRAGNEFLFQMQAMTNIALMNEYGVKKIVTACPRCFNILENEYPQLGGNYDVLHHSQFLSELLASGMLKIEGEAFKGKKITFHDPCYLGRGNNVYEAPRDLIKGLTDDLVEMKRSRRDSLCCGAGGSQMFKEAEKGNKEINMERTDDVIEVQPDIAAVGCPFCMTMISDGVKMNEKEIQVLDLAELVAKACNLD